MNAVLSHRLFPVLAVLVSLLLHGSLVAWIAVQPSLTQPALAMQSVTVDIIAMDAQATQPSRPVEPSPAIEPVTESTPLLEDEMAVTHKVIPKKTVVKKQPTVMPVKPSTQKTQPSEAVTTSDNATKNEAADVSARPTSARYDANYLNNPAPVYPSLSRRLGEEGKVLLRVQVSAEGKPLTTDIHVSSGSARLDEAARKATSRWQFVPAYQGTVAVVSWVEVPVEFHLEKH